MNKQIFETMERLTLQGNHNGALIAGCQALGLDDLKTIVNGLRTMEELRGRTSPRSLGIRNKVKARLLYKAKEMLAPADYVKFNMSLQG